MNLLTDLRIKQYWRVTEWIRFSFDFTATCVNYSLQEVVWLSTKRLWSVLHECMYLLVWERNSMCLPFRPVTSDYALPCTVNAMRQIYFRLNKKFDLLRSCSDEVVRNKVIRNFSVSSDLCNNSVWNTSHVPSYEVPCTPWRYITTGLAYLIHIREFPTLLLDWRKIVLTDHIRDFLSRISTFMS
jgi:hypothetical protein